LGVTGSVEISGKVSHSFGSPVLKPGQPLPPHCCGTVRQVSGLTWPASSIGSVVTNGAASTARLRSSLVTSLMGLSGLVACRNHTLHNSRPVAQATPVRWAQSPATALDTLHRAKLILDVMTELVGQHVRLWQRHLARPAPVS
jgi:hypothetical protein